jgi:hypothetical protein
MTKKEFEVSGGEVVDALSKLVEEFRDEIRKLERESGSLFDRGFASGCRYCADKTDSATRALRPVIEKLVEAGQAMRDARDSVEAIYADKAWDAALATWKANGEQRTGEAK